MKKLTKRYRLALLLSVLVLVAAVFGVAIAANLTAEIVFDSETGPIAVAPGESVGFEIRLSASGSIHGNQGPNSTFAQVYQNYVLNMDGTIDGSNYSDEMYFWASDINIGGQLYEVTWEDAPSPYIVENATIYVDPNTPPGEYIIEFEKYVEIDTRSGQDDQKLVFGEDQFIAIIVTETNNKPELEEIEDKSIAWGNDLEFTAAATDPDDDGLTFSLAEAPAGATIDAETGEFNWSPTSEQIGPHNVKVQVTDDGSPALSAERLFSVTVSKRQLTITTDDAEKKYGSPNPAFSVDYEGFVLDSEKNELTGELVFTTDASTSSSIGQYAVTASGVSSDNYIISFEPGTLTITPKAMMITASDQTKTYGDFVTFTGTEFDATGLVEGDTIDSVTLTSDGADIEATVNGSPYDIVASAATGTGLSNYSITYVNGELTVNAKALSITADNKTKTYGETVTFTGGEFTEDGLVNDDSVTGVTLSSDGALASATVAGSPYDIVASGATGSGLSNYSITYVNGELTVNAKTLTITADNKTKTYGETVTFAGNEFTAVGLVSDDTVTGVTLASVGADASATVDGSPYDIVASGAIGFGLSNYTITYEDGELTVGAKGLTITADNKTKTYGESVSFAEDEFTEDGLVNDDSVTAVTLTSDGALASATVNGSPYDIVASGATGSGLSNYSITYVNGELTVTAKALTITADNKTKTYGESVSFAEDEFTEDGLVNDDSVTGATLFSDGALASATVAGSPYTIVAADAVGTGLSNYSITYVNGELTVNAKALTITADNKTKTYGETVTFTGEEFTAVGLVNEDTVTSVTLSSDGALASATVDGSPYDIVASGAIGSGLSNYTITYEDGELTVGAKGLTITADKKNKTYGDIVIFTGSEFTAVGLVNSDTVTGVTLNSDGTVATATVAGSPYDIVASGATGSGLSNYSITYVDGELTVDTKTLTITADNKTKTYGESVSFAEDEFTEDGLVNDDSVTGATLFSDGALASATVAGSPYTIVVADAVGTGLSNYSITYVNGELSVDTKTLTITADNKTKTYGETVTFNGDEFTAVGLVNEDTVTSVTLTSVGADASATVVDSPYDIVVEEGSEVGSGLENYEIYYVKGFLTVEYDFIGLLAPFQSNSIFGSKTFKHGSTVPVKFQLCDADNQLISDVLAETVDTSIAIYYTGNGANGIATESLSNGAADKGNWFRYDKSSQQFIFNLGTKHLIRDASYEIQITIDNNQLVKFDLELR